MSYDPTNIFAKMLRGEVPVEKLHDDAYAMAFADIAPDAPVHVLVVPKGEYQHFDDFMARADAATVQGFFAAVRQVATNHAGDGFRLITNNGELAGQTVHHFHVHILGGKKLGRMVAD